MRTVSNSCSNACALAALRGDSTNCALLLRQRPRTAALLMVPTPTTPMDSGTRALPTLAAMTPATSNDWRAVHQYRCGSSWRSAKAGPLFASVLHYASSVLAKNFSPALAHLCRKTRCALSHSFGARPCRSKRDTPPERKHMALIRRASTTAAPSQPTPRSRTARRVWQPCDYEDGRTNTPSATLWPKGLNLRQFNEAFGWMSRVALQAEAADHHPEWTNLYSIVEVTLTTHAVDGLSDRDIQMADFMDHAAARFAPKPFK